MELVAALNFDLTVLTVCYGRCQSPGAVRHLHEANHEERRPGLGSHGNAFYTQPYETR